jgi:hypothetical protein
MADHSDTLSDNFDDNNSSKVNTLAFLSAIGTKANVGSISTSRSTPIPRLSSSIHKHCRTTTKEEKIQTKKHYFCKYCSPQDLKGHHTSTQGLQRHLQKQHNIQWSLEENSIRTTARDLGENSIQELYEKLLARGEVQGLGGEVLKRTV